METARKRPLRLLAISHSAVVQTYQEKYSYIGSDPRFELSLALPRRYKEGSGIVECYTGSADYTVFTHWAPFGTLAKQNAFFMRSLTSTIRRVQPDIIYFEEEPESLVSVQIIAAAQKIVPKATLVMYSCSNIPLDMRLPHEAWIKRLILPHFEQFTLPRLDALVCMNTEGMLMFREYYGIKTLPMTVLAQYGTDERRFYPPTSKAAVKQKWGFSPDMKIIGYAGRMLTMKGVDILIKAFELVRVYHKDVHLVLLGEGDDKETFRKEAEELGLLNNITFARGVSAEAIADFYRALDLFVLPSRTTPLWKEQFGRVLTEAMACGVPVIGSSSGAIPEVVGDAGATYKEDSSEQLAAALLAYLQDTSLYENAVAAALRRIQTTYSNKVITHNLMEFLLKVHQQKG